MVSRRLRLGAWCCCLPAALVLTGLALATWRLRTPPEQTATIPLRLVRITSGTTNIIVPVTINGRGPYPCVLDTGSPVNLLSPDTARRAGIAARKGPGVVIGFGGTEHYSVGTAGSLAIASAVVDNVPVTVVDMSRYRRQTGDACEGLIGLEYLRHFRVTLDFPAGQFSLMPRRGR